ncbi:MAG: hypothetical protein M0Z61_03600 [Nitrospiraceae bacterium]|nr:hypothetical protein [Nitrospiraceae bacterium]
MKNFAFSSLIFITIVLLGAHQSLAQSWDPGSGNIGVTLLAGYEWNYFNLSAENPNVTLTSGTLNGFYGEVRGETEDLWSRLTADYSTGNPAFSEAAIFFNPDLPRSLSQKILNIEGDLGVKVADLDWPMPSTLTLYGGLAYRDYKYSIPMGSIDFSWYYGALGFNYIGRLKRMTLGVDGALQLPFSSSLEDNSETSGTGSASVTPDLGYRVELPMTWDIHKSEDVFWREPQQTTILLFVTPYWQYWKIPAWKVTYPNGSYADSSASTTNTFGVLVGAGVNLWL